MPDNDELSRPESEFRQEREGTRKPEASADKPEFSASLAPALDDDRRKPEHEPEYPERERREWHRRFRRRPERPHPAPPAAPPFPPYPPYAPFPPYPPYPPSPPMIAGADGCGGCGCGPAAKAVSGGGAGTGVAPGTSSSSAAPGGGGGGSTPGPTSSSSSSSSASGTPGPTSQYTITSIPLAPMSGIHNGAPGTFSIKKTMVVPASVSGAAPLAFDTSDTHKVTTMLFQITDQVVPNWFGVAIPGTLPITDFGRLNIFFHPSPAQGGWSDSDYPSKNGDGSVNHRPWPEIFRYMELLGYQVDSAAHVFGANPNQIVIMPFMTSGAIADCGIFPASWFGICTDILTQVRTALGGSGSMPVQITDVVVSSFSVGLMYSIAFRQKAVGLSSVLRQVWDFDGYPQGLAANLRTNKAYTVVKYDQGADSDPACIKVPFSRWSGYPNPPANAPDPDPNADPMDPNYIDTHHLIPAFLFEHAATKFV